MAPVPQHNYTREDILEAVRLVQSKSLSIHKACRLFKIPYSTLGDKLRGRRPLNPQSRTLLRPIEEERLVSWIKECDKRGLRKSRSDIKDAVKAILDARGAKTQSADNRPSKQWLKDFFKHHPELLDITQSALKREKAIVSRFSLDSWLTEMTEFVEKHDPTLLSSPERIYTADETRFNYCPQTKKIIPAKGSKRVYSLASNTRPTITVIACCSATGHYLPPLIIYPYKKTPAFNLLQGFEEATCHITPKGQIDSNVFLSWLRNCFVPSVAEMKKPVLLFVGHIAHLSTLEIVNICQENDIILYCSKSHASHIQPLDQALFGAVKDKWEAAAEAHLLKTGQYVSIRSFASALKPVWEANATSEMAFNGFSKSGILPHNPSRVLDSEKLVPNEISVADPPSRSGLMLPDESASSRACKEDVITLSESTSPDTTATNATTATQQKDDRRVNGIMLQNVRKLLQFTVQAGPENFESLWSNYIDDNISSGLNLDPQFDEFRQLLDAVIKTSNQIDIDTNTSKQSEAPSTSNKRDDTFALPQFLPQNPSSPESGFKCSNVKKKPMPMVISDMLFRKCLTRKEKGKEDKANARVMRKIDREERKKRKTEREENKRRKMEREENKRRKMEREENKKRKTERENSKKRKMEREDSKNRKMEREENKKVKMEREDNHKNKMEREENKGKVAEQGEGKQTLVEKKQKWEEEKRNAKEAMEKLEADEALLMILEEYEKKYDDSADGDEDEGMNIVYDGEVEMDFSI